MGQWNTCNTITWTKYVVNVSRPRTMNGPQERKLLTIPEKER